MPEAIAATVVSFFQLTGTAAAVTSALVQVAVIAGANAVVQNNSKQKEQGQLINLQLNSAAPRQLVVGKRLVGGTLVDWYVNGADNTKLYLPIYLSEGPCGQIKRVYAGGRLVYDSPLSHGVRTVIPDFRSGGDRLWLTYYDGRAGQSADATLVGLSQGWTSANKMTGCAWVLVECQWDSDNMRSPPELSFEMEGAKLYDRRKDTTAGGSGSHRLNDPATWEWSDNPAVALDHYLLGRYLGSLRTFGIGLSAEEVPYSYFAAQANVCDEDVDLKAGGTQKRYRANGFIGASEDYSSVITKLCTAMAARPADFGGRFGVIGMESRTPVLTIDDGDLIAGSPEVYTPKRSWAELVGEVEGRFQDPAQLYQPTPYPNVTDAAWADEDGGEPKIMTLDLEFEVDVERAQRLATLKARAERRQATLRGVYPLWAVELERGDWFIRTGDRWGVDGKTFEVLERVLNTETWTVSIVAQEVDAADSAWDETTAQDGPPAPVEGTDTLAAIEVPAITVSAISLTGTASTVPAIKVQWTSPADLRVRSLYIECENTDGTTPKTTKVISLPSDVNSVVFQDGIVDGDGYAVSARFLTDTSPSDWCVATIISASGTYAVGSAAAVPWSGVSSRPANLSALSGSETINNALAQIGENAAINSDFVSGAAYPPTGWGGGAGNTTGATFTGSIVSGARNAIKSVLTGTTTGGTAFDAAYQSLSTLTLKRRYLLPVVAGDVVGASALLAKTSVVTHTYVNILWYDAAGTYLSENAGNQITASANGDTGNPSDYALSSLVATAPTNARFALLLTRGLCTTGAVNATVWTMSPMLCRLPAGQTVVPPYAPGPTDRAADQTSANTAAAITGQGTLATVSSVTAPYISVGDPTNFCLDPNFDTASYWTLSSGATLDTSTDVTGTLFAKRAVKFTASGANPEASKSAIYAANSSTAFAVEPSTLYRLKASTLAKSGFNGRLRMVMNFYTQGGAFITAAQVVSTDYRSAAAGADTVGSIDGQVTTPSNAAFGNFYINVEWPGAAVSAGVGYVAMPRVNRALSYTLLTSTAVRLGTNITRNDGTTSLTDALAVTSLGTAAAITSQGALATASQVNLGASGRVYRDDGTTRLTDALAVTSLGTAAAITAQGALATLGQVNLGASGRVYRDDGATRLTDSLAVTSLGTAAAITGQGQFATASHQRGTSWSGTPTEGCTLSDTSTNPERFQIYTGGVWRTLGYLIVPAQAVNYEFQDATSTSYVSIAEVTMPSELLSGAALKFSAIVNEGTSASGTVTVNWRIYDVTASAVVTSGTFSASTAGIISNNTAMQNLVSKVFAAAGAGPRTYQLQVAKTTQNVTSMDGSFSCQPV